jgi:diguanylate cyclase (GGDEF)-like protein
MRKSGMATILVVEDEPLIAGLLRETLSAEGYTPLIARTGEEAVHIALRETPHLVILDIMLPGMDGFEVVKALRANLKTAHIPVIILSARHDTADKVRAFEHRVDDYLTKPYNTDELLARIRTQLRHVQENWLHPLTGLPGGVQVERAIMGLLEQGVPWSLLYLDLNNFKAYNDAYGFLRGNEMIRVVARISLDVVRRLGNETDFVGHVGGDDFVVATTPDRTVPICQALMDAFDRSRELFYNEEDLLRGAMLSTDRRGNACLYPLVGLAIGVVTNQHRPVRSIEEVSRVAAEVKKKAKEADHSAYYIDKRGPYHPPHLEYHLPYLLNYFQALSTQG